MVLKMPDSIIDSLETALSQMERAALAHDWALVALLQKRQKTLLAELGMRLETGEGRTEQGMRNRLVALRERQGVIEQRARSLKNRLEARLEPGKQAPDTSSSQARRMRRAYGDSQKIKE